MKLRIVSTSFSLNLPPFLVSHNLQRNKNIFYCIFEKRAIWTQASDLFEQLAKGLLVFKKNKEIHRDIKPQRITEMDEARGRLLAKFIDFGLSTKYASEVCFPMTLLHPNFYSFSVTYSLTSEVTNIGRVGPVSPGHCPARWLAPYTTL